VGQGYRDFSPRLSAFETALLQRRICHGAHPLLNMAVANAIAVQDPSGNKKLDKSATSQRIDPIVAAVMAAFPCTDAETAAFDISGVIG
jgi:phage terminase large subunit-like protein